MREGGMCGVEESEVRLEVRNVIGTEMWRRESYSEE
jgi:hypothetical protein